MKRWSTQAISDREYIYDAFISYDHRDIKWVRGELLRHLDSEEYSNLTRDGPQSLSGQNTDASGVNISGITLENQSDDFITADRRFRFCLADRDFKAGESIEDNIMQIIKQSRKVVFVLSDNFLKSKWCNLELELSAAESYLRGVNILIPIKLGHLKNGDMWSCLRWFVRHVTYIEWKEQTFDRPEFWKNLAKVLHDPSKSFWPSDRIYALTE
jgi:toll-like receptor 13